MWRSAQALIDAEDRPAFGIWRRADIDPHTPRPRQREYDQRKKKRQRSKPKEER